jgi:hypothetical protein
LDAHAFVAAHGENVSISNLTYACPQAASSILRRIMRDYSRKAAFFNIMLNPLSPEGRDALDILRRLGFRRRTTTNLVVRRIGEAQLSAISEPERWNISGLWTEGYGM